MGLIGEKIKALRKEKKLSQKSLADLCGISNTYVSDIESGRTNPSLKTLQKLGVALEVNIKVFFE